jgi:hypothetical protein
MTADVKRELRVARRRNGRFVWEIVTHRGAGIVLRSSWPSADYETEDQARRAGQEVLQAASRSNAVS